LLPEHPPSPGLQVMGRKDTYLSGRQIEGLIANGNSIIIVDQMVLRVDAWLSFHPGGHKVIQHMVGKDATDEVNRYYRHPIRVEFN